MEQFWTSGNNIGNLNCMRSAQYTDETAEYFKAGTFVCS